MNCLKQLLAITAVSLSGTCISLAHDAGHGHDHDPGPTNLKLVAEKKGPVKAAAAEGTTQISGQGFWKFVPVKGVLSIPQEAQQHVKGAHGTLIVDAERDTVYWGLQKVGWISYTDKLTKATIIKGDAALAKGNLHGADLLYRKGKLPLVAVADNEESEVYVSDTSFQNAQKLEWPQSGPYSSKQEFHPTDVAFTKAGEIYVTDGYGKAFFMPADTEPLKYQGAFFGGKDISQTPHGITYNPGTKTILVSARPEGRVKEWNQKKLQWLETVQLPAGSTVCDVDVWGDYALAPCLNGPQGKPGPIYIINLKKKTIASIIRPKEDLGFTDAQHIHDATWYFSGKGKNREVYILFTNWNPGGIGALKLVQAPDTES